MPKSELEVKLAEKKTGAVIGSIKSYNQDYPERMEEKKQIIKYTGSAVRLENY